MNDSELNSKIFENVKMKIAISNFEKEDKKVFKKDFFQIAATFVLTIGLASGVVYAGVITYQNIMQEPKKVENVYSSEGESLEGKYIQYELTEEEKKSSISEDEARKKAITLLEKFGYSNKEIYHIRLISSPTSNDTEWYIETTDNICLLFDAKSNNYFSILPHTSQSDVGNIYTTTKEDAKVIGLNFCKQYGYNPDDYDSIVVESNAPSNDQKATSWTVQLYKEYNNIKNPYQCISIHFATKTNELLRFDFNNYEFENNELIITEERSKTIAIENDKRVEKEYEIEDIKSKLSIVQMNGIAYYRENDYENFYKSTEEIETFYKTESIIRKAWVVTITHKYNATKDDISNSYHKYFTYYIDSTTGEIIGGKVI